ncbi:hypothetical protein HHI36_011100 [Cryptolaemus montrouzieri]|uniref:Carboxylesterase type B domain-containing protein n=1 Tax=Cryptolaemus montrouzieri TaxID=559131 RepID=A0ABD2MKU8_9CUCU
MSDQTINNGVLKHAELSSKFTNVFLYQFAYDGKMGHYEGFIKNAGRVGHIEDMNYIWRRNTASVNNLDLSLFPENDKMVQKRMLRLYTNFAKYLNPTPKKDPLFENIEWTP